MTPQENLNSLQLLRAELANADRANDRLAASNRRLQDRVAKIRAQRDKWRLAAIACGGMKQIRSRP